MQVEIYIQQLLFEHNCVVIPDFGGFIAELKAVEIHPITNRFAPPAKRIAFNEQLKSNDGLLALTISRQEEISMDEAYKVIRSFVASVNEALRQNRNFVIPEIGTLYYNIENRLEFEPDTRINYLEESFGLYELHFKPVERKITDMSNNSQKPVRPVVRKQIPTTQTKEEKKETTTSSENKGSGIKMVFILIPLILLVGGGATIVYMKQTGNNLATLFNFGGKKVEIADTTSKASLAENLAIEDSLAALADNSETSSEIQQLTDDGNVVLNGEENPAKQNLIDKQNQLNSGTETTTSSEPKIGSATAQHGRYFVIVGSFISRDNAFKFRNKLASYGNNVTIIEPTQDERFFKVALDDFDNKEAAIKRKNELVNDFGSSVWVMSY